MTNIKCKILYDSLGIIIEENSKIITSGSSDEFSIKKLKASNFLSSLIRKKLSDSFKEDDLKKYRDYYKSALEIHKMVKDSI